MTDSDIFEEFERLWANYRVCSDAARQLSSPNAEDDEFIKMAIVGFSNHQKTDAWAIEHWEIANTYRIELDQLEDSPPPKSSPCSHSAHYLGFIQQEESMTVHTC